MNTAEQELGFQWAVGRDPKWRYHIWDEGAFKRTGVMVTPHRCDPSYAADSNHPATLEKMLNNVAQQHEVEGFPACVFDTKTNKLIATYGDCFHLINLAIDYYASAA